MSAQGSIVGVGMSTPLGLDARQSALLLRAAMAFRLGFAPARSALVALASEDRLRGAFALEAP